MNRLREIINYTVTWIIKLIGRTVDQLLTNLWLRISSRRELSYVIVIRRDITINISFHVILKKSCVASVFVKNSSIHKEFEENSEIWLNIHPGMWSAESHHNPVSILNGDMGELLNNWNTSTSQTFVCLFDTPHHTHPSIHPWLTADRTIQIYPVNFYKPAKSNSGDVSQSVVHLWTVRIIRMIMYSFIIAQSTIERDGYLQRALQCDSCSNNCIQCVQLHVCPCVCRRRANMGGY